MKSKIYTVDIRKLSKLQDLKKNARDFVFILYNDKKLDARKSGRYTVDVKVYDDGEQLGRFKRILNRYGIDKQYASELFADGKYKKNIKENEYNTMNKNKAIFESAEDIAKDLVYLYGEKTGLTVDDVFDVLIKNIDAVYHRDYCDIDANEIDWDAFYDIVNRAIQRDSRNINAISLDSVGIETPDDLAYFVWLACDEDENVLLDVDDALCDAQYQFASGELYCDIKDNEIPDSVDFIEEKPEEKVDDENDGDVEYELEGNYDDDEVNLDGGMDDVDEGFVYVRTSDLIRESKEEARAELLSELQKSGRLLDEGVKVAKPTMPKKGTTPTVQELRGFIRADKDAIKEYVAQIKEICGKHNGCDCYKNLGAAVKELDVTKLDGIDKCMCTNLKKGECNNVVKLLNNIKVLIASINDKMEIIEKSKEDKKRMNESVTRRFCNNEWSKIFESDDEKDGEDVAQDEDDKKEEQSEKGENKDDVQDTEDEVIEGDKLKVTFGTVDGKSRDEVIDAIKKDLTSDGIPEEAIDVLDADGDEESSKTEDIQVVIDGEYAEQLNTFCDKHGVDMSEKLGGEIEFGENDKDEEDDKKDDDDDKKEDDAEASDIDDDVFGGNMFDDIFGTEDNGDTEKNDKQEESK